MSGRHVQNTCPKASVELEAVFCLLHGCKHDKDLYLDQGSKIRRTPKIETGQIWILLISQWIWWKLVWIAKSDDQVWQISLNFSEFHQILKP
jgi:hypothetical protein